MKNFSFSIFQNETFIDLGLYQYGKEKCNPGHSYGPATRNHYLFHYIFSGRGTLYARNSRDEDVVYELHGGQGFLISPNQITTYIADENNPWVYAWVEFDGMLAKETLNLAGFSIDSPIFNPRYEKECLRMQNELIFLIEHPDETSFALIGHLYLLLDALIKSSKSTLTVKKNTLHDYYIKEAINFIEQNYQNNISVEDIADVVGINRSYFGKIFREQMGKSPQEFLLSYRMIKASKMLLLSTKSIEEIGKAVGYESQFHFSRAFKTVYGMSPLKWLKSTGREEENPIDLISE